jgi:hypothetical protein
MRVRHFKLVYIMPIVNLILQPNGTLNIAKSGSNTDISASSNGERVCFLCTEEEER